MFNAVQPRARITTTKIFHCGLILTQDTQALKQNSFYGISQAPVVVNGDEHYSFCPDKNSSNSAKGANLRNQTAPLIYFSSRSEKLSPFVQNFNLQATRIKEGMNPLQATQPLCCSAQLMVV